MTEITVDVGDYPWCKLGVKSSTRLLLTMLWDSFSKNAKIIIKHIYHYLDSLKENGVGGTFEDTSQCGINSVISRTAIRSHRQVLITLFVYSYFLQSSRSSTVRDHAWEDTLESARNTPSQEFDPGEGTSDGRFKAPKDKKNKSKSSRKH